MDKILYFAYGSNMFSRRLRHSTRVPAAKVVGVGFIKGYRLTFDKRSNDESGKCDAEATANPDDHVYGVVFELPRLEKQRLDQVEALGYGYEEKAVTVTLAGKTVKAVMYYATDKDKSLHPYHWYKAYVLAGAREHGLPEAYITSIENIRSIDDPDINRAARASASLNDS